MLQTSLLWGALCCYAIATIVLVRQLVTHSKPQYRSIYLAVGLIAVSLEFAWYSHHFIANTPVFLHFFSALALSSLGMALLTLMIMFFRPVEALGVVVLPLAALFFAIAHYFGLPTPALLQHQTWQITLHALLALLAYAMLCISSLLAIILAVQENALKKHRLNQIFRIFPPFGLTESLMFQSIAAGLLLLTCALLSGVLFVHNLFAQHLVHKTILSIIAWFIFSGLLLGRYYWGWRGKRAVRWVLSGMFFLLLAFIGSKFVLDILLQRF